ncbi:hypothetical protein O0I10_013142 [Lichtheimia ornata]|uniref:ISXO2-like transposase domain-containing protein n=1 Tax=Lichtheimia ornata TaxID=688661 RepID=A0AAD7XSJ5_9FUNG|nr:uncharacterized protein O0I10_013142 [Lichtheimia ornata]KAJ8651351.1 hypothetical protein O0I10_013142 [Lichtheimia ornata]
MPIGYIDSVYKDPIDVYHNEDVSVGGIDEDGNRIIVEVDEFKFGKRKSHKGHRVEGVWVVGGVERTPERKIFVTTVEDRKKDTLHLILSNYIKEDSEIRTDCWKGYNGLARIPSKRYRHEIVNHAKEFKTAAGVHTNTIDGTWNGIKSIIKARHRTAPIMKYRLVEFIFRRKHAGNLWGGIIKALKEVKRERSDLDHDDSEFNDNTQWETDTEDDDDTSGEYTADSHRKRPRGQ